MASASVLVSFLARMPAARAPAAAALASLGQDLGRAARLIGAAGTGDPELGEVGRWLWAGAQRKGGGCAGGGRATRRPIGSP